MSMDAVGRLTHRTTRRAFAAQLAALALLPSVARAAQTASPPSGPLRDVSFRLNALAVGVQSPFYLALDRGYYRDQGLNVSIKEGSGSGTTVQLIGSNQDNIGLADSTAAILGRSKGLPVTIVGQYLEVNSFGIISLKKTGITKPEDLVGKKVGVTTGDGPMQLFPAVEKANNLDDSKIQFVAMAQTAKVPSLLRGQVDAILGGADDQAVTIQSEGEDVNTLYYSDYGAPTVGLGIIANDDVIKNDSDFIRRFLAASLKGMADAESDPDAAVAALTKHVPTVKAKNAKLQLQVDLGRFYSADSDVMGKATTADWDKTYELLTEYVGVPKTKPITDYYNYSLLPADVPKKP